MRHRRVLTRNDRLELHALRRAALAAVVLCFLFSLPARARCDSKNVLFVFSSQDQQRRDLDLFERALRTRVPHQLNFYTSYVDYERMGDGSYRDSLAETFHYAYKNVKLDVAVVSSIEALRFVTFYREKILPGVPIIFYALSPRELEGQRLPAGVTGRTSDVALRETIDLALRLHPGTQAVAIVTEAPGFWWAVARSELDRHRDRVKEIDLFGPPSTDLLARIAALPPRTLILFQLATLSAKESDINPRNVLVAAARHLPTYCAWKAELNYGCVGGAYVDWAEYVDSTAEIAARVLGGELPEEIPVTDDSNFKTVMDWRELQRWRIPESALPPGTEILYREPTFWETNRRYVVAALVLIAAQALLIAGLLWQRTRKRKAEAVLRESEQRFRVMADTTPSLVWMCDAEGKITYLNEQRIAFTGPEAQAGYCDLWPAHVHPDDLRNVLDTISQALGDHRPFSAEYRLRRNDGSYRWMLDVASPRMNGDGSFAGLIGSAIDVTDQKLAQKALERLSGQLIEAQEKERSRIARELHDDICQRLALLSMKIEEANQHLSGTSEATKRSMQEIGKRCEEIAGDVQLLSHQLHSSVLDFLGIGIAISRLCNEFAKRHDVRIDFYKNNLPERLPRDIALCLFRVAQEALHNSIKYSGARLCTVELTGTAELVKLVVRDEGRGFDVEEARRKGGLGLLSMQERAHLVQGTFSVESAPGEGTRIVVAVPLAGARRSAGKASEEAASLLR